VAQSPFMELNVRAGTARFWQLSGAFQVHNSVPENICSLRAFRRLTRNRPIAMSHSRIIRPAAQFDDDAIWRVIEPVFRAGETYPLPGDISRDDAFAYWRASGNEVFVAEDGGWIVGTYYLRANNRGGGSHVANCGYIVAANASRRGVARAMCVHSLERARGRGFTAMQFNFVISSNERAVRLWQDCGFAIVGTLPGAFAHPIRGLVDAYVMYRSL
jgi:ribosomal protein S18 acetylase RimI-like enzyme